MMSDRNDSNHFAQQDADGDHEFAALLLRYLDGVTSDEDHETLRRQLASSAACRDAFIRLTRQVVELGELANEQPPESAALLPHDSVAQNEIDASNHTREQERPAPASGRRARFVEGVYDIASNYITLSLLISTIVMAIIVLSMGLIVPDWNRIVPDGTTPSIEFIAVITDTQGATWDKTSDVNFESRSLLPGDLVALNGGLAEITYEDGVKVLIEGPCTYVVDQIGVGTSGHGRIVAKVPAEAIGFTIHTPVGSIIDLGTEFGVEVTHKTTTTHVFSGKVEFQSHTADGQLRDSRQLVAGETMQIAKPGGIIAVAPTGRPRYARFKQWKESTDPLVPATPSSRGTLIAYWDFNSAITDRVTDVSGHAMRGVMSADAELTADGSGFSGKPGDRALRVNTPEANMVIAKEHFTRFNPGRSSFTVTLWAKYESWHNLADHAGTNGYDFGIAGTSPYRYEFLLGDGDIINVKTTSDLGVTVGENRWHHVALVVNRERQTCHVFVDGMEETAYSVNNVVGTNKVPSDFGEVRLDTSDLLIGTRNGAGLVGEIDDYAIFGSALTADQIGALAASKLTPHDLNSREAGKQE